MSGNQSGDPGALGACHLGLATSLPIVAGWVFLGFGAATVLGGILLAVDDPVGLALIAFGTVFVGAGSLAKHLFGMPYGQASVQVGAETIAIDGPFGAHGQHIRAAVICVDGDADADGAEAARRDWLYAQWHTRPDWVAGRLIAEDERNGHWQVLTAWLWSGFAVLSVIAALLWGDLAVPIAIGAVGTAIAMVVLALRLHWRLRHFGANHLILEGCPAVLGGTLSGLVETGVEVDKAPLNGFFVELTCTHRWEQPHTAGLGSNRRTRRRRQVLWTQVVQHSGQAGPDGRRLTIPVHFELPADRPSSTLASGVDGVIWELAVSAALPGLDYLTRFQLPVLAPRTAEILGFSGQTKSYPGAIAAPSAVTF